MRLRMALRVSLLYHSDEKQTGVSRIFVCWTRITRVFMSCMKQRQSPVNFSIEGLDLKKYEAEGVDISLITSNLQLSLSQRLKKNMQMLDLINQVRKQKKYLPPIS